MRNIITSVFYITILATAAHGDSFLSAGAFPKTFDDLTFQQKIAVEAAGFEPWEKEFDASGQCISGCPYHGITLTDVMLQSAENTATALKHAEEIIASPPPAPTPTPTYPAPSRPDTPTEPQQNAAHTIPLGLPLAGAPQITSPYGPRTHPTTKKQSMHEGVDFAAPVGTTVYSPAIGTVAAAWTDKTCGNGLRITHSNGYETVYCHLSAQLVKSGDTIKHGQPIAKTGNTGRTTGPHLHYGIKYNGNYIDPTGLINRKV